MGLLITFEGTDCSGKETQTNLIIEKLKADGYKVAKFSYPNYESPTGKIIAGPYLAKFGEGYFPEGASNVPAMVASLYYSADRLYNQSKVEKALAENDIVILDRYSFSNFAHQGSKIADTNERNAFFEVLEKLEFNLLELKKPDHVFFLHMPTKNAVELRKSRTEKADQHESDLRHLEQSEQTYLDLCKKYNFIYIPCTKDGLTRSIYEINEEVYAKLKSLLNH